MKESHSDNNQSIDQHLDLDTAGKRIRSARKRARYNQEELGKLMGVSRMAVGLWEADRTTPNRKKMRALAAALNTSSDWLLRGEGPEIVSRKSINPSGVGHPQGDIQPQTPSEEKPEPISDLTPDYTCGAPFLSPRFCGNYAPGQVVDYLAFQKAWMLQTFATRPVNIVTIRELTDEMAPAVGKGDLVVLTLATEKMTENGLYMIDDGTRVVTRRLQRMLDNSVRVICDNPAYENEVILAAAMDKLRIIGRVLMIVKQFQA